MGFLGLLQLSRLFGFKVARVIRVTRTFEVFNRVLTVVKLIRVTWAFEVFNRVVRANGIIAIRL